MVIAIFSPLWLFSEDDIDTRRTLSWQFGFLNAAEKKTETQETYVKTGMVKLSSSLSSLAALSYSSCGLFRECQIECFSITAAHFVSGTNWIWNLNGCYTLVEIATMF